MNSQVYNTSNKALRKYRNRKDDDAVFNSESDIKLNKRIAEGMSREQAQKELEDGEESPSSSFSDKMDEMEEDELIKDERE